MTSRSNPVAALLRRLLRGRKVELPRDFLAEVRQALVSRGFDVSGWTDEEEIARRLGRTQGAVSQRLQRERAQVRQWFEGRMAG